jgi:cathepsin B
MVAFEDAERLLRVAPPVVRGQRSARVADPTADPDNDLEEHRAKELVKLPPSWDWRERSPSVREVVDQRACGACWAVATATCLADRAAIATNGSPRFSPLELIVAARGCRGCRGCGVSEAMRHAASAGLADVRRIQCDVDFPADFSGVREASAWPEEAAALRDCFQFTKSERYFFASPETAGSCESIKREIFARGPVVATMRLFPDFLAGSDPARGRRAFEETGGVYEHSTAYGGADAPEAVRERAYGFHAVVLVGWGQTREVTPRAFWIVRNSWGASWGEGGFFRAAMSEQANGARGPNAVVGLDVPVEQQRAGRRVRVGGVAFCAVRGRRLQRASSSKARR